MIGGIYQEWTEGGRIAGRDNEGLMKHMQTLVTKRTILTGDARKADEYDHLSALMNMGYKVGHAGDTYYKKGKNGNAVSSALDWRMANGRPIRSQKIPPRSKRSRMDRVRRPNEDRDRPNILHQKK